MKSPPPPPSLPSAAPTDEAIWDHYTRGIKKMQPERKAGPKKKPVKKPAPQTPLANEPSAEIVLPKPARLKPAPVPITPIPVAKPDRQTWRKLKRGVLGIDAEIDLHGLSQIDAHARLVGFVSSAYGRGFRRLRVITGKGGGFKAPGVLRRNVPLWLNDLPLKAFVSSLHHPPAHDGGEGVLIVTLKKNPKSDPGV